jgi:hypothetical protein
MEKKSNQKRINHGMMFAGTFYTATDTINILCGKLVAGEIPLAEFNTKVDPYARKIETKTRYIRSPKGLGAYYNARSEALGLPIDDAYLDDTIRQGQKMAQIIKGARRIVYGAVELTEDEGRSCSKIILSAEISRSQKFFGNNTKGFLQFLKKMDE